MADKPVYAPYQIENAITTSWGDDDTAPRSWDTNNLTYYIYNNTGATVDGGKDESDGEAPLTQNEEQFFDQALAEWSEIANLTFTEVGYPDDADITAAYSSTTTGDGTYTDPDLSSGDTEIDGAKIWFSTDPAGFTDQQNDITYTNYGFITMMHEIGHALGLSHPGPYNADQKAPLNYADDAVFAQDNRQYTIMSYFGYYEYYMDSSGVVQANQWTTDGTVSSVTIAAATPGYEIIYPSTPMVYDMLAMQDKYGANYSTRAGDTTYGFNSNAGEDFYDFSKYPQVVFTIWDGGGNDTIDASKFASNPTQTIDLTPGNYSSIGGLIDNIGIAFGTTIENAIGGGGADTIIGNLADNYLVGNGGDDHISGGSGNDTLDGGDGKDVLDGGPGEDLLLGGADDDVLYGGQDGDVLMGGAGDDYLDGGGNFDADGSVDFQTDYLTGGAGNDTFFYGYNYWQTTITDFTEGVDGNSDMLDLSTEISVHDFTDLLADATQQGTNTVIKFNSHDTLTLENFQLDTLTPDEIKFAPPTFLATGEFPLATNPYNGQFDYSYFTKTAALSDGNFVGITLDADTYFTGEIKAAIYDSRGVATGQTFTVNTTPLGTVNGSTIDPDLQVVTMSNGDFVAVWQDAVGNENTGTNGPFMEIRYRVFNADGTPQGSTDYVADLPGPVIQHNVYGPTGTSEVGFQLVSVQPTTGDPGFIVNWVAATTDDDPNHQEDSFTRTFDYEGDPSGAGRDLGVVTAYPYPLDPSGPVDYTTPTDGVVQVWEASDGTTTHAYAQILGHTDPVQLDQSSSGFVPYGSGDGPDISVSELADGDLLFTWGAGGYYATNYGVITTTYTGSESIIYDSKLQGFTKAGTSGDDVLKGSLYDDHLYGLAGNDTLIGGPGADYLDGGDGSDTVDYTTSLQGVNVDLTQSGPQSGGDAEGDILVSIENIIGTSYNDDLLGDEGANVIYGGYGNDYITGNGGADSLHGGGGNDNITLDGDYGQAYGEAGNDTLTITAGSNNSLSGGTGDDTLIIDSPNGTNNVADGGDGNDVIDVTGSSDYLTGDAGNDQFDITGSYNYVSGGADDDIIVLEHGDYNYLQGNDGNDSITVKGGVGNTLDGGTGNDTLSAQTSPDGVNIYGDEGNDVLIGGAGDDFLYGGAGNDTISGGGGTDLALFDGPVSDFKITYDPTKGLTVEDLRAGSPDGTDQVANDVEELQFGGMVYEAGYFHSDSKAQDGYLVGATVFADANHNGALDPGEAFATTDAGGGFSLPAGASGPLILTGGTDSATGLAFRGELMAPSGYGFVNSITTLVELLTQAGGFTDPEQTVETNLGIASTDLASTDPIVNFLTDNGPLEVPGVEIDNTVDLIASAIEGANTGQFASAYNDAFHALASAVGSGLFYFNDTSAITHLIDATLALGHFTLDQNVENGLVQIIAGVNTSAEQYANAGGSTSLADLSAIAEVAQGDAANAIKDAAADPSNIADTVASFTGTALTDAINQDFGHTGDIDGAFINNPPTTVEDDYTINANQVLTVDVAHGVLANDLDFDGHPLTAVLDPYGGPSYGTVTMNADGSFTYTPNKDFAGQDSFSYEADDGTTKGYGAAYIDIEGPHPVVTNVMASPASGVLQPGDPLTITVTMSSAVAVDQTNGQLELYSNDGQMIYQSGSGTDTLVFTAYLYSSDPRDPLTINGNDIGDDSARVFDAVSGAFADLSGADVTFADLSVACYCPGTSIATEQGECAVEALAIGDRVATPSGLRPIKWVGRRSYSGRFVMGRKDLLPICFKAGSLGEGLPRRELWISPHHAMYLDGLLVEAKDLVNGVSIVQVDKVELVEYFHIELESHDVILAEGAWSETFVDDDSRAMFHNAAEFAALYPAEAQRVACYCAPRVDAGFELDAIRQRLALRAGLLSDVAKAAPLSGFIDRVTDRVIEGWAQAGSHPDVPVCLDIYADGKRIGRALADRYREDLRAAGVGSGHHAFAFTLPRGIDARAKLEVRRSIDGIALSPTYRAMAA